MGGTYTAITYSTISGSRKSVYYIEYSLSQMKLKVNGETEPRKYAHIFIMQSVTKKIIEEFVEDLRHAYDEKFFSKQESALEQRILFQALMKTPTFNVLHMYHSIIRAYSGN